MKFILVVYLCSFASTTFCDNGGLYGEFNSWKECAESGYSQSLRAFKALPEDMANDQKLAIKFECKPIEIKES